MTSARFAISRARLFICIPNSAYLALEMNTLKRLSWNNSSDHLQLPTGARSPRNPASPQGPPLGTPPGSYPFPTPDQSIKAASIEQITLHKSLDALHALLGCLDDLKQAAAAQARAESKLAKAQKELQKCFSDKMEDGARDRTVGVWGL